MNNTGWGDYKPEVQAAPMPMESEAEFTARRDTEILNWKADKEKLAFYKAEEAASRARVTATLFPTPKKGTQRYELGNGYRVKLVHGNNYTLGNKDMPHPLEPGALYPVNKQVEDLQEAIANLGNEGPFLAERLIKWKPELSETEYLALDPEIEVHREAKALIDAILTVKPASPQLELEEPKPGK